MSAPTPTAVPRTITLAELARHGGQDGSHWIELQGKIYDVSGFAPRHPGGGLLALGAGRPTTTLFEAYHPGPSLDRARKALAARGTLVGTLAPDEQVPYGDPAFFDALRGRVDEHLRARGLGYHSRGWLIGLEAVVLLLMFVGAWAWRLSGGGVGGGGVVGLATGGGVAVPAPVALLSDDFLPQPASAAATAATNNVVRIDFMGCAHHAAAARRSKVATGRAPLCRTGVVLRTPRVRLAGTMAACRTRRRCRPRGHRRR